jgi:hypothetical protein
VGTFHQGKHQLHGITVVVETTGSVTYVGRCDDIVGGFVHLLDVGEHDESSDGADGTTKATYIEKAVAFGVWPKHSRLTLNLEQVTDIKPLAEYASS